VQILSAPRVPTLPATPYHYHNTNNEVRIHPASKQGILDISIETVATAIANSARYATQSHTLLVQEGQPTLV